MANEKRSHRGADTIRPKPENVTSKSRFGRQTWSFGADLDSCELAKEFIIRANTQRSVKLKRGFSRVFSETPA
jgi:hypothetical protein